MWPSPLCPFAARTIKGAQAISGIEAAQARAIGQLSPGVRSLPAPATSRGPPRTVAQQQTSIKPGCGSGPLARAPITNAIAPIRYAEIAVPGNDRKERVSEIFG